MNEDILIDYLYKNNENNIQYPNIDMIIRTGKVSRLAPFMTFNTKYSEICFPDCYFPDFDFNHLFDSILHWQQVQRRFGK